MICDNTTQPLSQRQLQQQIQQQQQQEQVAKRVNDLPKDFSTVCNCPTKANYIQMKAKGQSCESIMVFPPEVKTTCIALCKSKTAWRDAKCDDVISTKEHSKAQRLLFLELAVKLVCNCPTKANYLQAKAQGKPCESRFVFPDNEKAMCSAQCMTKTAWRDAQCGPAQHKSTSELVKQATTPARQRPSTPASSLSTTNTNCTALCCEPMLSCSSTTCPSGQVLRANSADIKCDSEDECLQQCCVTATSCGSITCPTGQMLRTNSADIKCGSEVECLQQCCTDPYTCEKYLSEQKTCPPGFRAREGTAT